MDNQLFFAFTYRASISISDKYSTPNIIPLTGLEPSKPLVFCPANVTGALGRTVSRITPRKTRWINLKRFITSLANQGDGFPMIIKIFFFTSKAAKFLSSVIRLSAKRLTAILTFNYREAFGSPCLAFGRTIFCFVFTYKMFSTNSTRKPSIYHINHSLQCPLNVWGRAARVSAGSGWFMMPFLSLFNYTTKRMV